MADKRINLDTVSISQAGHGYLVRFLTGSEEDVRTSLMKADLSFRENKVLVIEIANKPGQWLRVAQKLADGGIEISHTYRVGEASGNHVYAYGVSDYAKARKLCRKLGKCAED